MKKIVATLNIGNCAVHDNARRSMRAAAARWGADYLEILYATGSESHPYYQKLRLADHFPDGVRVLYLDGDIVVRCDCPSPFEIVPVGHFGACRSHHPSHAGATWHVYQPLQDYSRATGVALDPKEEYVHAGLLLFEFPTHRSLFAEIHDTLLMQFPFASQWPISDQAPISTAIKKLKLPTFWLPPMFQMSGDVLWWGWTAEMQFPVLHFCGPIDRLECIGRTSWDNLGADRRVSGTDVIRWSAGKPKALLNEPELPMLIREMSRVRFGVIVELGSWLGGSAWWGAECARDNYSDYYCVDTWRGDLHCRADETIYQGFLENIRDAKLDGIVKVIKKPSAEAAQDFEDESVDLLFVDADNTYEGVRSDLDAWWPKVKTGGVFLGHDYLSRGDYGVERAVNERFGQPDEVSPGEWPIWKVAKRSRIDANGHALHLVPASSE